MATTLFDDLVPLSTLGLLATVVIERIVAYRAMRWLEYRADAVAAQRTSVDAVVSLLAALDDAAGVNQAQVPWFLGLFSTHPSYAERIARLRKQATGDEEDQTSALTTLR